LTVVRGQDDTTAVSFDSGDNLQLRVTAATLDSATRTDVKITGGSVSGTVIDNNTIGADELNVSGNGTSGQYLGSDADGTFTWTSISADPTMGGDLSGTASNAQLGSNVVTDTELNSAKLNGIESGATADQTNAQIKTAYEANANSNEFSDAEQTKLSGIEASATADQSASEIKTAYESNADTNEFSDAEQTKLSGIATSANNYSLPTATSTVYGGVKVSLTGTHLTITA
jgi:hypothetical protein